MKIDINLEPLKIRRGDSDSIVIKIINADTGLPENITGWEFRFTVREDIPATSVIDDTDAKIHKMFNSGDTSGIATIPITTTDTNIDVKTYYYDVQYKTDTGDVDTLGIGNLFITPDITRKS